MSRKLKDKVRELEQKHQVISEDLLDAIWIIDMETLRFEYITPSIEKISGYTSDEYLNLRLADRLNPDSYHIMVSMLAEEQKRFEQGIKGYLTLEQEAIHKDGSTYWIEIRVRFIRESDNSLKMVGVSKGITGRKKVEQQQNELIQQLNDALAEKERLLEEVKRLEGLLPICSGCRRIRDDNNRWWPLDAYVKRHTEAQITHTICPDCTDVLYNDL
jgi:PAS domain S-box-containing protein